MKATASGVSFDNSSPSRQITSDLLQSRRLPLQWKTRTRTYCLLEFTCRDQRRSQRERVVDADNNVGIVMDRPACAVIAHHCSWHCQALKPGREKQHQYP